MRILDAWIEDPLLDNIVEQPYLKVEVDAMPNVSIPNESFQGGWEVSKLGPFIQYSRRGKNSDAGDFNVRFRRTFPSIVDIKLAVKGQIGVHPMALPLPRARQLIRKHDPEWRLLLGDHEAQSGKMIWIPSEIKPVCRHWDQVTVDGQSIFEMCEDPFQAYVRSNHVSIPLCKIHLKRFNSSMAAARTA